MTEAQRDVRDANLEFDVGKEGAGANCENTSASQAAYNQGFQYSGFVEKMPSWKHMAVCLVSARLLQQGSPLKLRTCKAGPGPTSEERVFQLFI